MPAPRLLLAVCAVALLAAAPVGRVSAYAVHGSAPAVDPPPFPPDASFALHWCMESVAGVPPLVFAAHVSLCVVGPTGAAFRVEKLYNGTASGPMLPVIANGTLTWSDESVVAWSVGCGAAEAEATCTKIGSASGAALNALRTQFVPQYVAEHPEMSVVNYWAPMEQALYLRAATCGDFAHAAVDFLRRKYDAHITGVARSSFLTMYTATPVPVDAADPSTLAQIVGYYTLVERTLASTTMSFVDKAMAIVGAPQCFAYVGRKYYAVTLVEPFVSLCLETDPAAGPHPRGTTLCEGFVLA